MTKRYYPRRVQLPASEGAYLERFTESPQTLATVRSALEAFYLFRVWSERRDPAPERSRRTAPAPLATLSMDVLVDFRNWLHRRRYAPLSRDTYITLITAYLAYAQDQSQLAPDFSVERARTRHRTTRKRHAYPVQQVNPGLPRLLRHYDDMPLPEDRRTRLDILRARAVLHTLYASAGRVSEIASLTRKEIQDGRRDEAVIRGKGDKERFIFFTPEAQAAIRAYITARGDASEPVFIHHRRRYGQPMSRQSIWELVHDTAAQLGIGRVSPHDFRHYRATQMRNAGAAVETIQAILGHADISTTLRVYAHLDKAKAREQFDRTITAAKDLQ
jgi:site-specific recombinase XerD